MLHRLNHYQRPNPCRSGSPGQCHVLLRLKICESAVRIRAPEPLRKCPGHQVASPRPLGEPPVPRADHTNPIRVATEHHTAPQPLCNLRSWSVSVESSKWHKCGILEHRPDPMGKSEIQACKSLRALSLRILACFNAFFSSLCRTCQSSCGLTGRQSLRS